MLNKLSLLCSLLLLHFFATAQSKQPVKDSSNIIIFNQGSSTHKPAKHIGENNIIKIAPLGFLSGTFPLLYERRITDFFSVQVSGGGTGKDYSRAAFQQNENVINPQYPSGSTDYDNISEGLFNFNFRKAAPGYMFSIQPRLYFASEALEGSFMGLSYDYYQYNFNIPAVVASSTSPDGSGYTQTGAIQKEHENVTDYMVHFGYQSVYDRLTFEYTTAIGMRNVSGVEYVATPDGSGGVSDGFATYTQHILNFNMGIKVGYHF